MQIGRFAGAESFISQIARLLCSFRCQVGIWGVKPRRQRGRGAMFAIGDDGSRAVMQIRDRTVLKVEELWSIRPSARFGTLCPESRRFESHSSRHVVRTFTHNCL